MLVLRFVRGSGCSSVLDYNTGINKHVADVVTAYGSETKMNDDGWE